MAALTLSERSLAIAEALERETGTVEVKDDLAVSCFKLSGLAAIRYERRLVLAQQFIGIASELQEMTGLPRYATFIEAGRDQLLRIEADHGKEKGCSVAVVLSSLVNQKSVSGLTLGTSTNLSMIDRFDFMPDEIDPEEAIAFEARIAGLFRMRARGYACTQSALYSSFPCDPVQFEELSHVSLYPKESSSPSMTGQRPCMFMRSIASTSTWFSQVS